MGRPWLGLVAVASSFLVAAPAHAQFGDFLDAAKRKAEEAATKAADDATADKPAAPQPEQAAEEPAPKPAASKAKTKSADDAAPAGAAAAAPEPAAGEVYGNRFDFVPGDKIVLYDDFSDTPVGDYPRRWTMGEGGAPIEVVEIQGKRWLMSIAEEGATSHPETHSYIRTNLEKELPEKFSLEFDVPATAELCVVFAKEYWTTGSDNLCFGPTYARMYWAGTKNDNVAKPTKPLRHVAVAVSGTNIKFYLDGQRALQNPDGVRTRHPLHVLGIYVPGDEERPRKDIRLTNVKYAAGGKDYAKELVAGRIVTHGITFDTGSDVIRPESGPTLRDILKLLQNDAALRFEIQGHTDNQGTAAVNDPLSARRAAAVKAWLVKEGVADGRLKTKGLGASKPMDSNETSEGRARNRRVEFVKLTGQS